VDPIRPTGKKNKDKKDNSLVLWHLPVSPNPGKDGT
jgi:hypothetical protein